MISELVDEMNGTTDQFAFEAWGDDEIAVLADDEVVALMTVIDDGEFGSLSFIDGLPPHEAASIAIAMESVIEVQPDSAPLLPHTDISEIWSHDDYT